MDSALYDYEKLKETVRNAVIGLVEVMFEGLPLHPLEEQRESVDKYRQIGLSIMGLADMFIKLSIKYGSKDSVYLSHKIGYTMAETAIKTSLELSDWYGTPIGVNFEKVCQSKFFKNHVSQEILDSINDGLIAGIANSQLLTIAPTGSISTMLGISGGIEPIYDYSYTRKTESLHGEDTYYKIYTPIVAQYMEMFGIDNEDDLPDFFTNAMKINPLHKIDVQSAWQDHIDASISCTVNLPKSATVEDVYNIYMYSYEQGLKGLTVFRDGCKRHGILTQGLKDDTTQDGEYLEYEDLPWGTIIKPSDHSLIGKKRTIRTGCGNLHVQAFFDNITGRLMEVFFAKGSHGGCQSYMIGLSRSISSSSRAGVSFENIIDQLKSVPACPSYVTRHVTKRDASPGTCCPGAIGFALIDMKNEILAEIDAEVIQEHYVVEVQPSKAKKTVQPKSDGTVCPECETSLIQVEGCISCQNCGWSKCS